MCVKVLLAKKLPYVPTVDDLIALEKGDLDATGGRNSRLKMLEQAVRRAVAANVPIVFGSGATSEHILGDSQRSRRCALSRAVPIGSHAAVKAWPGNARATRKSSAPASLDGPCARRVSVECRPATRLASYQANHQGHVERGLGPAVRAARHLSAGVGG